MQFAQSLANSAHGRDEIYLAVANLFDHHKGTFSKHERELAADILKRISKDVEMSIRIGLAERLAHDQNAPRELILMLADDRVEVAKPILARSPVLSDADLIQVIEKGTEGHQIAIAERPAIGETVTAALARSACELALIVLLRNESARIGKEGFQLLSDRARTLSRLQQPLVAHRDLPPDVAHKLHAWVSGALKTALAGRFPDAAKPLAGAVDQTTSYLETGKPPVPEGNAKKLVEKMQASGQLRASFLIRVLNEAQMDVFEHGFAALLAMDVDQMRTALYGASPITVALACRAAGIDRAVFMTVFKLSRHHRQVTAQLSDSDQKQIWTIFSQIPKTEALSRLRAQAA
jgi:uncharacterized protein (DUF2336 family)